MHNYEIKCILISQNTMNLDVFSILYVYTENKRWSESYEKE